jgi:hypothetical protein
VFKKIREWLHRSPHFHIRADGVNTIRDVIDLVDRFVDGKVRYPLEWDDFISWPHQDPNIEVFRERLGACEPYLFSKAPADRVKAVAILIAERNRIAALIGLPSRQENQ